MPKKNTILLPKDNNYEDIEEEIVEDVIPKPIIRSKKQILPKNDDNEQEKLIKQLLNQLTEKKLKEKEIKIKGKRGPKLPLSEKHIESLKNGRKKLKQKWEDDKVLKKELTEKYAVKLANKKIKNEYLIKQKMGLDDNDDNYEEEPIKIIQPIKPKKKKTIILEPQSDSEEEIIIKKNNKKKVEKQEPNIEKLPTNKIIFF